VLHNHASLHTFTELFVHVDPSHSVIVHVTGVHDTIGDTVSVYVNVDV
jgi:hypothetical protein